MLKDKIRSLFGDPHAIAGDEVRFNCPWCERNVGRKDTKGHLYVNFLEKYVYHCFRCGESGSLFSLFPGVSKKDFQEVGRLLGAEGGASSPPVEIDFQYPVGVTPISSSHMASAYLAGRGLSWEQIRDLRFGVSDDPEWFGYVILPFYFSGRLVYWQGRDYLERKDVPKYKNPPNLPKSPFLYGICEGIRECWFVEGTFDAILSGVPSVALLGKSFPHSWLVGLEKVLPPSCRRYIVALDPDAVQESLSLCRYLLKYGGGREVFLAQWPRWLKDPGDLGRSVKGVSLREVSSLYRCTREGLLRFDLQKLVRSAYGT